MQAVIEFTERAIHYAQELSARAETNLSLTNVGHSLGGAEAIVGHTVNGARTFTYNPLNPDVLDVYRDRKYLVNHNIIVNHTMAFDIVNAVSEEPLPGKTLTYARPDDEEQLKKYGYSTKTDLDDSPIFALIDDTVKGSSHSLFEFVGESSVLQDNTARERAEKLSDSIDEFREDVSSRAFLAKYSGVFLLGSTVLDLIDVKRDVREGWENLKNFFRDNDAQQLFRGCPR